MVRVENIENSLDFYCNKLGLNEVRRVDNEKGRFTLIFLGAENSDDRTGLLELTYNWDPEAYTGGRNFGHLAYSVKNIYDVCDKLMKGGVAINRPPRDGHLPMVYLLKFYKKVKVCQLKNLGFQWRILVAGKL
jgi:lactoylglutathione lyase